MIQETIIYNANNKKLVTIPNIIPYRAGDYIIINGENYEVFNSYSEFDSKSATHNVTVTTLD